MKEEYCDTKHSVQDILDGKDKQTSFCVNIDKMQKGDYSLGACITRDGWFGEFYLFLNLIKWTVTIGWQVKDKEQ